ncbi:MAG: ATP-binding cassette domain-containing protein, partial [Candidatus Thermoplasmatota archaeon]
MELQERFRVVKKMSKPIIGLENVSKTYMTSEVNIPVLRDVDIKINNGEFVVILGPSGCGKTTLLNLISGIDIPDKGKIEVKGKSLSKTTDKELTICRRDRIGYEAVTQLTFLYIILKYLYSWWFGTYSTINQKFKYLHVYTIYGEIMARYISAVKGGKLIIKDDVEEIYQRIV